MSPPPPPVTKEDLERQYRGGEPVDDSDVFQPPPPDKCPACSEKITKRNVRFFRNEALGQDVAKITCPHCKGVNLMINAPPYPKDWTFRETVKQGKVKVKSEVTMTPTTTEPKSAGKGGKKKKNTKTQTKNKGRGKKKIT